MYVALCDFVDLKDNRHLYHTGDVFPRSGTVVTESRILELTGNENCSKKPLIIEVEAESVQTAQTAEEPKKKPKPTRKKVARKTKE